MGTPVTVQDYTTSVNEKFTLDYALRINTAMGADATYSSAMRIRWTNAAKAQYLDVYSIVHALT